MTKKLGVFETKTHFSEVIEKVQAGERFIITKRGEAVAEIRPIEPAKRRLERGCAANSRYRMSPDFDEPLEDFDAYM